MIETVACEKMLERLNWKNYIAKDQYNNSFSGYMFRRSNLSTAHLKLLPCTNAHHLIVAK